MSTFDALHDGADELAWYLFDPKDEPDERYGRRRLACLVIMCGLAELGSLSGNEPAINAAIDGDRGPLEEHIGFIRAHARNIPPLDQDRREWDALIALVKALDDHIVPLLPDLDWLIEPKRTRADERHEEYRKAYGQVRP